MKGQVPVEAVKDLSLKRANAIKEALLKKYTDLDANRFNVDGVGWDRPVDPLNQTKNRRVEIKVSPPRRQLTGPFRSRRRCMSDPEPIGPSCRFQPPLPGA